MQSSIGTPNAQKNKMLTIKVIARRKRNTAIKYRRWIPIFGIFIALSLNSQNNDNVLLFSIGICRMPSLSIFIAASDMHTEYHYHFRYSSNTRRSIRCIDQENRLKEKNDAYITGENFTEIGKMGGKKPIDETTDTITSANKLRSPNTIQLLCTCFVHINNLLRPFQSFYAFYLHFRVGYFRANRKITEKLWRKKRNSVK